MSSDTVQALINHHLHDLDEGLKRKSVDIALFSLADIKETLRKSAPRRIRDYYASMVSRAEQRIVRFVMGQINRGG